jgi:uncharacterized DUF497 family protein
MRHQFEWFPKKATSNLAKHGVSFEEAATVFDDPLAKTTLDEEHSIEEQREIIIGRSNRNRLLFVSFRQRTIQIIRIISARLATRWERTEYEENT